MERIFKIYSMSFDSSTYVLLRCAENLFGVPTELRKLYLVIVKTNQEI